LRCNSINRRKTIVIEARHSLMACGSTTGLFSYQYK
jgi:hypothetical protein